MTAKRMIVTSNIHPSQWYKWIGRENQEEALKRRFVEFGFIMGWTKNGLDKVDPEDFWPILPTKNSRTVYALQSEPVDHSHEIIQKMDKDVMYFIAK